MTDSRNVYDRMQQPYISPTGEQKRIDMELLAFKESQRRTNLAIRWVNAQAMLANSLTKKGEDYQCNRCVACGFRWKLVDDPEMFSGRKRAQKGLDGLGLERAHRAELQDVQSMNLLAVGSEGHASDQVTSPSGERIMSARQLLLGPQFS